MISCGNQNMLAAIEDTQNQQEDISVECQPPACRRCRIHSEQIWACLGEGGDGAGACIVTHCQQTHTTENIPFPCQYVTTIGKSSVPFMIRLRLKIKITYRLLCFQCCNQTKMSRWHPLSNENNSIVFTMECPTRTTDDGLFAAVLYRVRIFLMHSWVNSEKKQIKGSLILEAEAKVTSLLDGFIGNPI